SLGVTPTLAFIAPNLRSQCSAYNDVLGRKTPSKTFSRPLLVAIHGFTASGITAPASAGRRNRLVRQKLSHAHHCRSRVGYHLPLRQMVYPNPICRQVYCNTTCRRRSATADGARTRRQPK